MMKKTRILALLLLLACLPAVAARQKGKPIRVCDLRTEHMTNPMSLNTATPRLGWRIEADVNEVMQTGVHIIVASTREKAEALEGDLWDATLQTDQSQ